MNKWSDEIEDILNRLRINCVNLSEYHRKRFYHFKSYGKWFRLPMIILASVNSTASVGLQPVLDQTIISGITCLLGMVMGIIGAVELYMGIQASMELELKQSKEFYTLAIDIYKTLSLVRDNRGEDGKDYLNKKYSNYIKICEASNLLKRKLKVDLLTQIPNEYEDKSRVSTPAELVEKTFNKFNSSDNLELFKFPNHDQIQDPINFAMPKKEDMIFSPRPEPAPPKPMLKRATNHPEEYTQIVGNEIITPEAKEETIEDENSLTNISLNSNIDPTIP